MRNIEITIEKLKEILKDKTPNECDWRIVYDIFEIEHRKNRCGLCQGFGYVNDTYCSSYTKNGQA